ncbi:MAG: helix-turn-helix transcriptional regulator [Rikenellaceae bacterium]
MENLRKNIFAHNIKSDSKFVQENNEAIAQTEERIANSKIVLRLLKYMREHGLKQKDLAEKLSVTPQYINKLLRGKDLNLSISTAIRYGIILGIKLISVDETEEKEVRTLEKKIIPTKEVWTIKNRPTYGSTVSLNSNIISLQQKHNSYEKRLC